MNNDTTAAKGCHRKTVPERKLSLHDPELSPVLNIDTAQSRIVAKLAQRHGLSLALAFTLAELAGFQTEMSDER